MIKASYALPAVFDLGGGVFKYGTKLANSRTWFVPDWGSVHSVAESIGRFFDNEDEFSEEEDRVLKDLEVLSGNVNKVCMIEGTVI